MSLLQAEKAGADSEPQLQLQAFEAFNEMVRSAAADTLPTVQQLIPVMLKSLTATLQAGPSTSMERQSDLQVGYAHAPCPPDCPQFCALPTPWGVLSHSTCWYMTHSMVHLRLALPA